LAACHQETAVATDDRSADQPPAAGSRERESDVRASFLHDAFFTLDDQLEATLPPDDPDADLARGSITFSWRTRRGLQPVIMPLWRRLD
jgi:hypothetical protein